MGKGGGGGGSCLKSIFSCCSCMICTAISLVLIAAVVIGVALYLTGEEVSVDNIGNLTDAAGDLFRPPEPAGSYSEAQRWDATSGLTLVVENALDESWIEYFDQSLLEWNETEALMLLPTRIAYEKECSPSQGRLKVCNGDYGNTDWRGINVFVTDERSGHIIYSNAKMNDFHVKQANEKQYTMCHEIGHGFGLPHTDENPYNVDRGECMDYTQFPGNNKVPGEYNLNLLVEMYGTPSQPRGTSDGEEEKGGDSRNLRSRPVGLVHDIESLWRQAEAEAAVCSGASCSVAIGNGYRVGISKVLV